MGFLSLLFLFLFFNNFACWAILALFTLGRSLSLLSQLSNLPNREAPMEVAVVNPSAEERGVIKIAESTQH